MREEDDANLDGQADRIFTSTYNSAGLRTQYAEDQNADGTPERVWDCAYAGGGWRQAGMLAAAGLHALDHHVARLADDHRRAEELGGALGELPYLAVDPVETNMVWADVTNGDPDTIVEHLKGLEIRVSGRQRLRMVVHLDVDDDDISSVISAFHGVTLH